MNVEKGCVDLVGGLLAEAVVSLQRQDCVAARGDEGARLCLPGGALQLVAALQVLVELQDPRGPAAPGGGEEPLHQGRVRRGRALRGLWGRRRRRWRL